MAQNQYNDVWFVPVHGEQRAQVLTLEYLLELAEWANKNKDAITSKPNQITEEEFYGRPTRDSEMSS
jgi:hypothetical protein